MSSEVAPEQVAEVVHDASAPTANGHDELEQGVADMNLEGGAGDLHRACAEGNLDQVRAVLSTSLADLETLDGSTGCTPIVLAIRGNHADVVRELLSAGAIVPPPGLTSDPLLLSILYPQPMYVGMPYGPGGDYYGQPQQHGYMPMSQPGQPFGRFSHMNGFSRKESPPAQSLSTSQFLPQQQGAPANLPPAEVAKSIPCRNFPNCKYGASCVFFHPTSFYPSAGPGMYMPNFEYGQPGPAPFYPSQGPYQPPFQGPNGTAPEATEEAPPLAPLPADNTPTATAQPLSVFVPSFQPGQPGPTPLSPPSQFGMSPLSPSSMMSASLPSLPPAEQFFATSPPSGGMLGGFANGHIRRQSFNQPNGGFGGMGPKPFGPGHVKKPSFSGGPRPWGSARPAPGSLGTWKDGNPPPCAFFTQGKCRNGEFCKFPHIDTEGNDVRHPDIVRGIMPPLPSLSRQSRGMRMNVPQNFGPYDPSFRHQQQMNFMAGRAANPTVAAVETATDEPTQDSQSVPLSAQTSLDTPAESVQASADESAPTTDTSASVSALPEQTEKLATAPIARSASQPGVQRSAHRSHSPASSNVSFHGNGHPRRAARGPFHPSNMAQAPNGAANGNGVPRRSSANDQRVPRADEFPALNGAGPAPSPASDKAAPGKTAAQVLSEPAPYRPPPPKATSDDDTKSEKSITMDSESDSDAVVISLKAPSFATNGATSAAPASTSPKRPSVSFASIASTVAAQSTAPAPLEAAAVGIKA